ncbi:type II toxin-antitoxin system VapC family toxin [Mucilaginibacter antarcticus]|uniref:Type II toxin-antitoxin system VapC family toxin n=1 Tax=Mucilaginibacter antarcticus TaxID=1855725 RepID=A0ABW5XKV6_9SPHI
MAFKVFLDANVLLDFTLQREKYEVSKSLMQGIINGDFQAFITPSIVHITGYWLTKAYGAAKAKEILLNLLTDIKIIDCSHKITVTALSSAMVDIEDALQYYTALDHKLDFFISRDKQLQKVAIPNLPVYLPENFLDDLAQ